MASIRMTTARKRRWPTLGLAIGGALAGGGFAAWQALAYLDGTAAGIGAYAGTVAFGTATGATLAAGISGVRNFVAGFGSDAGRH